MTGTAGFRNGRVRGLIVDDEPALTDVLSCRRRKFDRGRAALIHTVRGPGHAIRPVEDGR
ncbi:hypothetical protein AB5J55_32290 [Streptomyces sp. R11]|uniref:Response regulatory domain-containing protein n=1 Tax=Streptomyces sp. R11 TaxID=3238625 RepID=A0AB39N6D2_9ACTN